MPRRKTVFSGSDAGGIGFAVPSDYRGAAVDADPDKVIEQYNEKAKSFVDSVRSMCQNLPYTNRIRTRAERSAEEFLSALKDYSNSYKEFTSQRQFRLEAAKLVNGFLKDISAFEKNLDFDGINKSCSLYLSELDKTAAIYSIDPPEDVKRFRALLLQILSSKFSGSLDLIKDEMYELFETLSNPEAEYQVTKMLSLAAKKLNAHSSDLSKTANEVKRASRIGQRKTSFLDKKSIGEFYKSGEDMLQIIPDNVPNYRPTLEGSPRVCGLCRFFSPEADGKGQCKIFQFQTLSGNVCDAWQAKELTPSHTPIRRITRPEIFTAEEAGLVANSRRPQASSPANNGFLPGDKVYSRSLGLFATVQSVVVTNGQKIYGLKLFDEQGNSRGSGFSFGADLQSRKPKSVKRANFRPFKSGEDIDDLISVTRETYEILKSAVQTYKDFTVKPISNRDFLTPLNNHILKIMEHEMWDGVTTGPKRKYFRAMQNAAYAIGSARMVIFQSLKEVASLRSQNGSLDDIRSNVMSSQRQAYERIVTAFQHLESALTLPSATHNTPPPGVIEKDSNKSFKEAAVGFVAQNVNYDNIASTHSQRDEEVIEMAKFEDSLERANFAAANMAKSVDKLSGVRIVDRKTKASKSIEVTVESTTTRKVKTPSGEKYVAKIRLAVRV